MFCAGNGDAQDRDGNGTVDVGWTGSDRVPGRRERKTTADRVLFADQPELLPKCAFLLLDTKGKETVSFYITRILAIVVNWLILFKLLQKAKFINFHG